METNEAIARERVIAERRRRGWSQRRAAVAGNVANTHWANYERGDIGVDGLRQSMRKAVADAFGWDLDWPESEPAALVQPSSAAVRQVAEDAVHQVMKTMTDGKADILTAVGILSELHEAHARQLHAINTKLDAVLRTLNVDLGAIRPATPEDDDTNIPVGTTRAKRPSRRGS